MTKLTTLFVENEQSVDRTEVVTFRIPAELAMTIRSNIAAANSIESVNQFVRRVFFWGVLLHDRCRQASTQSATAFQFADMNGLKPVAESSSDTSKAAQPITAQPTRQSLRDIAREALPRSCSATRPLL